MDFNFPLLLVLSVFITGIIALVDRLFLLPRRKAAVARLAGTADDAAAAKAGKEPAIVETSKSIFPVLLFVLVIR